MRLTNSMIVGHFMRNLRSNLQKMDRLNNQLSTGKKIIQPSDDPVATLRSMQLQTILKENEQYINNIDQAMDWVDISEMSLDKVTTTLNRVRELAIYGSSDTLDQAQRDSLLDEVIQLAEHLVQVANTTIGERFIFSGHRTTVKPYDDYTSPYQGDNNAKAVEISKSIQVDYSIPGNTVFDSAFDALQDMIQDLSIGDVDRLSGATLQKLDVAIDTTLSTRAGLGAKLKRLELAKIRFEDTNVKHTQLLSEIEDVDIAETIMHLRMQENVYRSSLASGARIIQPTLMDFLR